MRHIITVTVENRFGVLSRIAGLFAGRGYNISSLAVNTTQDDHVSSIVLTVNGDDYIIEQVKKQLNRLIDVIKVTDLTESEHVERELMMLKITADKGPKRAEIFQLAEIFRARVISVNNKKILLEMTGDENKINAFLDIIRPYGIIEMVRTGVIGMTRG
jgi:acetolactate synthase-1/3 small subunit